jgi:hypothetical protein
MDNAILLVPAGASDQVNSGEMFLPVQSKLLNTYSSAIVAPGLMSGLVSESACAAVTLANSVVVKEPANDRTQLSGRG